MELNSFPKAIANLQTQIMYLDREIQQHKESIAFHLSSIDKTIAFNKELKNEAQRKAKRAQLIETDPDYTSALYKMRQTTEKREELAIELELHRNLFSVAKIEARAAVFERELNLAF